ncbi:DEAD/DEAH box helicase [Geminocystis sp. NIES-3709]|uniref:DEAD/DEAH box helicase n=1 Tax=Geminocystis sp. NIES-3709 TaxID=1617448 RepID=UPI0005FC58AB|nr:DEAD/DEAH box helicase [Geminocystis sp. NIES-3709]BAQ67102.1 putative helicase [Geminocystis sp. NIES-3709]
MLRDYQQKAIDEVNRAIGIGLTSVMVQSPTGSGKSVIMAFLLKQWLEQGKRILLVAHKIELIQQLYSHVHRWLNFHSSIMADSKRYRYDMHSQVVIASIQSWSYRYATIPDTLPQADIVIVDEAHHSASNSYSNLFYHYKSAIKIGFTATPQRLDNKGLRYLAKGVEGYQYLVKGVPVTELMEQGHLSTYKLFGAGRLLNAEGKVKITAGDYNKKALEEFVATALDPQEVVDTWLRLAPYKKTVLYPASVALSQQYVRCFQRNGIPSAHIDAKTSAKEREAILESFRKGDIMVLGQHSIVIEGVDVPDIEAVQFIRPTKSLVVWFQSIGRSLRPAEGKEYAIIIDHTTTHQQLAMPDFPVKWSLDPKAYKGFEPHLHCSQCHHTWLPSQDRELQDFQVLVTETVDNTLYKHGIITPCYCRKCNNNELHQWTVEVNLLPSEGDKPPIKEDSGLIIGEVELYEPRQLIIEELKELLTTAEEKGYKKAWVGYRALEIQEIDYPELLWLANELGYKRSWASYRYQQLTQGN